MQNNTSTLTTQDNQHSTVIELLLLLLAMTATLYISYESVRYNHSTSEQSLIEISQSFLLVISILICLYKQKSQAYLGDYFSFLSLLFSIVLSRELDQVLELYLPHGAWKVPAGFLFLVLLSFTFKNYVKIIKQLKATIRQNGFIIAVIGCYFVFIFSRVAGMKAFWMVFMGDNYERDLKSLIEESIELLGYSFMLIGVYSIRGKGAESVNEDNASISPRPLNKSVNITTNEQYLRSK